MANVSLVSEEQDAKINMELVRDNRPTALLITLACAELCIDALIGYAVFRIFKTLGK